MGWIIRHPRAWRKSATTTTSGATTTTSGAPVIDCNSCDPELEQFMDVTLSGLAGDLAVLNGVTAVKWYSDCEWWSADTILDEMVYVYYLSGTWRVQADAKTLGCTKRWQGSSASCNPFGSYAEFSCVDSLCDDADSCEDSAGGTAVVS